ncbi:PI-PLC X domain-containing protein At5g67130-like [Olea europaea var. sylvestris]|uniref:PI-PLC X domain-containing protein At5g67130-like n=1 Tax=Olea europaea var. sylvestris TaxID=158386 RepID=UPI000C1CCEA8|nr:PI-PLC X domain-containing protein At5g67130-like [Olea europaea var. sylvestris]
MRIYCFFTMNFYIFTLFCSTILIGYATALKQGETCIRNSDCGPGLHCETCLANNNVRPRCTRIQPINPLSKVKSLPFNRYTWLTTHNAFAKLGARSATGSVILSPENQQDSITSQLNVLPLKFSLYLNLSIYPLYIFLLILCASVDRAFEVVRGF